MQRMKRLVRIGWVGIIVLFLLIVCVSQESAASPWGYEPDSPVGQCLTARYGHGGIKLEFFPDRSSAHAAADADCDRCSENKCGHGDNSCLCAEWAYAHCEAWGYTTCNPSASYTCAEADHSCGVPIVGYGTWNCRSGLNGVFIYPLSDCPNYVPPIPQQDSNSEAPPDQTLGGGGNSCDDFVCNPVKVATGNKYEKAIDLSISTPGIPLEFVRHYNSLVATDGPLGQGWTHSFSANLQVVRTTPTMRVKIKDVDGRALFFSQLYYSNVGEVNFYGESGVKDRLKQITSTGQWVLKRKSNLTYLFDSNGILTQISDPNGNTLTFSYSGGLLTQVSNNFGNSITLQYSGTRISSVTDPKSQSVVFTYTGSDLTGVGYPDGQSLGYAYSNHNLTGKYDSSDHLIGHWDYDTEGRVSNYYRYVDNGVYQEQIGFTEVVQ